MEHRVVLTRYREEDHNNYSVVSFNKDGVAVSHPLESNPRDTPNTQQHRNRQSSPQVNTSVDITSTSSLFQASGKTEEVSSSSQGLPESFQRTNNKESSNIPFLMVSHQVSNDHTFPQDPNSTAPSMEQNCVNNDTITNELSVLEDIEDVYQDKESSLIVEETEQQQQQNLLPGLSSRRMAVCNDTDNAEKERCRMRVFKKRF